MLTSRNQVSSIYVFSIILLLALISISSFFSFKSIERGTNKIIDDVIPFEEITNDLLTQLINEETGVRGYLVTKDENFLEPYYSGEKSLNKDLHLLIKAEDGYPILADSDFQQALKQINKIQLFFEHQIILVQSGHLSDAQKNVSDGKALMDTYRNIHKKIRAKISGITDHARQTNKTAENRSQGIIFIGILLALLIGILSVRLFSRARQTENELRKSEEQLHVLLEHANDAIFVFSLNDDNSPSRYVEVNNAACRILDYSREELLGMSPINITPIERRGNIDALISNIQLHGQMTFEGAYIAKNGNLIPFEYSASILNLGDERVVMSLARDITERKKTEKIMEQMAYYDHLTNLPNRRFFEERLYQEMNKGNSRDELLAVMFLDLDGFKKINDSFGHESGDLLLQEVAGRLSSCIRKMDFAARLAGDEFTIILPNTTREDTKAVAKEVLERLEKPVLIKDKRMHVTSSIGISFYYQEAIDVQTIIKQADTAMYEAKQHGKNKYQIYSGTKGA